MTTGDHIDDVIHAGEGEAAREYTASPGSQRAGARTPARRSVPAALSGATDGDEPGNAVAAVQQRSQALADVLSACWRAKAAGAPPLAHARPPTLAEAREHIHAAAGHLAGDLWKTLRIAYGYLVWLPLILTLYFVVWLFRSPWGPPIGAAAGYCIIHWWI